MSAILFALFVTCSDFHDATPHVFRHSDITPLAKADVDLEAIQRISGHANIPTALDIWSVAVFGV